MWFLKLAFCRKSNKMTQADFFFQLNFNLNETAGNQNRSKITLFFSVISKYDVKYHKYADMMSNIIQFCRWENMCERITHSWYMGHQQTKSGHAPVLVQKDINKDNIEDHFSSLFTSSLHLYKKKTTSCEHLHFKSERFFPPYLEEHDQTMIRPCIRKYKSAREIKSL